MGENFLTPAYDKYSNKYVGELKDTITNSFNEFENASVFESEEAFAQYCKENIFSEDMSLEQFCEDFAGAFNIEPDNLNEAFSYLVDSKEADGYVSEDEFNAIVAGLYELKSNPDSFVDPQTPAPNDPNEPETPVEPAAPADPVVISTSAMDSNYKYVPVDTTGLTESVITNDKPWAKNKVEAKQYTDANGTVRRYDDYSYSTGQVTSSKIYDEQGRLVREENYSEGRISSVTLYDGSGNKTESYSYNRNGLAEKVVTYNSDGSVADKHTYTFENGVMVKDTSTKDGVKAEDTYVNGKKTQTTYKDGNNSITSIVFYDDNGNKTKEHKYVQKDGKTVIEVYDANGNATGEVLNLDGTPYVAPAEGENNNGNGSGDGNTGGEGADGGSTGGVTGGEAPSGSTFSENAGTLQGLDSGAKASRLYEATAAHLGTDEQTVYDLIMDENLTGEQLLEIMQEYEEQNSTSLMEAITNDFSCFSGTVTEADLRNRIFKLLQETVNDKTDYDTDISDTAQANAKKFSDIFNTNQWFFGVGHGDVEKLLGKDASDEELVAAITAYCQSHPDKNFMEEFCNESWWGNQETYINRIIKAYYTVLTK